MALKIKVMKATQRVNEVVMGSPLSGKTTYVNSQVDLPETLFISTDGNAHDGCQVAEADNWDDLMDAIKYGVSGGSKGSLTTIVLDLLDDAVAFAEQRAQKSLGMTGKADSRGAYGKFTLTVGELVKEQVLRPLLGSDKQVYIVMHSTENAEGVAVPCFGSYSRDATDILNWVKGRCGKVVRCENPMSGVYDVIVEAERINRAEEPAKPPIKRASKKQAA
ncbi:MAG: ATP-binding protein [Coriobacteriia bacterium]|nr:ATP-binding protein [Coriobacteriia bacterium]